MFGKTKYIIPVWIIISGCTYKVATPPAKFSSTETPSVLKKDKRQIKVDAGAYAEVFGPGLSFASLEYSEGLEGRRELSLSPFFAAVDDRSDDSISAKPYIMGISLDLKTNPSEFLGRHFAWYGGGGYAYSYYAQILSAHTGLILGYEGKYFVPFISNELFISVPFSTKPVPGDDDSIEINEWDDPAHPSGYSNPTLTLGTKPVLGLKINLGKTLSIIFNSGLAVAVSQTHELGMLHVNLGLEWNY